MLQKLLFMYTLTDKSIVFNPFDLLSKLQQKETNQFLEWSIKLTVNTIEPRFKPTLYIYPDTNSKENYSTYNKLNELLFELECPKEILNIQKNAISTAMYQGIRIPHSSLNEKCLFIHDEGEKHIHSYRWSNELSYDKLYYAYKNDVHVKTVRHLIHKNLELFFDSIINQEEFKNQFGIWFQEMDNIVHEVYLTFPSRPKLNWVLKSLEKHLSKEVYHQASMYGDLNFKNIGFDSKMQKGNAAITIYFTIPVASKFPLNYAELMQDTISFFK